MINGLLLGLSAKGAKLLLAYGTCAVIILVALIVMGFMKRNTKRQMRPESVKKACLKAKQYAEKALVQNSGAQKFLGATKLHKLSVLVAEAAWLSYQILENKKDILFDGIASNLDDLATVLSKESEQGYLPEEEYEKSIKDVITSLDDTIKHLDKIIGL